MVDNKDKDLEMYKKKYKDMLLIFDKEDYAKDVDAHINKFPMNGALFARNACIDFAKKMKKEFLHPYIINQHYKKNGEKVSM